VLFETSVNKGTFILYLCAPKIDQLTNNYYTMKRAFILLATALFVLTACNTHTVTVKYDILTVDIDFPYSEGSQNKLVLDAEVQFPNSGFNNGSLPRACEVIRAACFGSEYQSFSGSLEELGETWRDNWHEKYMNTCAERLKETNVSETDAPFLNWNIKVRGSFDDFFEEGYINYMVETSQFTGGANGVSSEVPMVLDLNTGNAVNYNVFTGNATQSQLSELLDKHKYDELELPKGVDKSQVFSVATIEPSRHFSVDDDGITFYYQPSEIAPASFGIIEIKLPWDELK